MGRPVGILCRCALCDSYFVVELEQVEMASYRGKKGKQALMDHFEKIQARYDATTPDPNEAVTSDREFRDGRESGCGHEFMRCPTCVEATHGIRYAEWVARGGVFAAAGRHTLAAESEAQLKGSLAAMSATSAPEPEPEPGDGDDTALSLVQFVSFDDEYPDAGSEPPPLFLDDQGAPGRKPKWTLCQGIGPPALEVDSSRSLRPFGIDRPMYTPLDPEQFSIISAFSTENPKQAGVCIAIRSNFQSHRSSCCIFSFLELFMRGGLRNQTQGCAMTPQQHIEVATAVYEGVSFHGVDPGTLFAAAPLYSEWAGGGAVRGTIEQAAACATQRERAAEDLKAAGQEGSIGGKGKPAERLAAALGIEFSEARSMIRKAKGGNVKVSLEIKEAIGFEVEMDDVGGSSGGEQQKMPGTVEDYSAFEVDSKGGGTDESVEVATSGGGDEYEYEPEAADDFM